MMFLPFHEHVRFFGGNRTCNAERWMIDDSLVTGLHLVHSITVHVLFEYRRSGCAIGILHEKNNNFRVSYVPTLIPSVAKGP